MLECEDLLSQAAGMGTVNNCIIKGTELLQPK